MNKLCNILKRIKLWIYSEEDENNLHDYADQLNALFKFKRKIQNSPDERLSIRYREELNVLKNNIINYLNTL